MSASQRCNIIYQFLSLESDPQCTGPSTDMFILGETISFSCQLTCHGHWIPQIICRDGDNNTLDSSSFSAEWSTITLEINVTATASMNEGSFTCTTNFPDPLDPPPAENEATNVPDYEHIHTFPQITVHCK